jgi:serine/threonine protein phosphatase PrpC
MDILSFKQHNQVGHPMEDYCLIAACKCSFAVADGVTRTKYAKDDFPDNSGASQAAKLFCEVVTKHVTQHLEDRPRCSDDLLREAFDEANRRIFTLNKEAGIQEHLDFVDNDYFGTVGASAYFCGEGHLHYGYIGDCRVVVFNSQHETKLQTPDQVEKMKSYLRRRSWEGKLRNRHLLHSTIRNNVDFVDEDGKTVGYGVLTGEQKAASYYRFGSLSVDPGDLVFLHTDGLSHFFSVPEFLGVFWTYIKDRDRHKFHTSISDICQRLGKSDPKKFGDDKALIFLEYCSKQKIC